MPDKRNGKICRTTECTAKCTKRCAAFCGKEKKTDADYCVELPFLPMYPVTLNYWQADEDFPASGRLMLDASAEHYLTIEDAVTVGQLLLQMLEVE